MGLRDGISPKMQCSYLCGPICRKQIGTSGCVPQPIAGPGQAGTKTHTAQDRDRPGGGRDELSYPETEQVSGSAHSNEDADQRGSVAVLIMATPNSR